MKKPNNHEKAESKKYEAYEKKQPGYAKSDKSGKSCNTGKSWKSFKGCK